MEEFLGVLFCGGKGTRLGEITKHISKSFIPVYDLPAYRFGLEILEKSKLINEILILTNNENDSKLKLSGYKTIIQDDAVVTDMFSGWEYVKKVTGTKKNGVLVPSDNICKVKIDDLISKFEKHKSDFLFSLHKIKDKKKLADMGCFDIKRKKFYYKDPNAPARYGVIAPYIIRNTLDCNSCGNIFEINNSIIIHHKGHWFDIGDFDSIVKAGRWRRKNK